VEIFPGKVNPESGLHKKTIKQYPKVKGISSPINCIPVQYSQGDVY
jgi:hypothetical protein